MKKMLIAALLLLAPLTAKAEDISFDFGSFALHVPFTTVSASSLWDFKAKRGLLGAETPLASYKRISMTGGAVTSLDGKGSPYVGIHVDLVNPAENFVSLAALHPGIFGGRDFHSGSYMVGLTLSSPLW